MSSAVVDRHHPDLERALTVLSRHLPRAVERARPALHQLLEGVTRARCPPYAWQASSLTADGFPVELAFVDTDYAGTSAVLRYTVAPWPETAPPACWIGVRHPEAAGAPDKLKLYTEVTGGARYRPASDLPAGTAPAFPRLADRRVERVMHGYNPADDTHEAYYQVRGAFPYHVTLLMDRAGCGDRAAELLDVLRLAYGRPLDMGIPGSEMGFSLAGSADGPPVFTLYLYARALWGADGGIRHGAGRLARHLGCDLGPYDELSAPLADRTTYAGYHGLLGLVIVPGHAVHMALGLRPPPVDPDSFWRAPWRGYGS